MSDRGDLAHILNFEAKGEREMRATCVLADVQNVKTVV